MTRAEKLESIYKEMANKERSIGCRINVKYRAYYHWETGGEVSYSKEDDLIVWVDWIASNGDIELNESEFSEADPNWYIEALETLVKIIWHPVMIGDVLWWIDKKKWISNHKYEEFVIEEVNMAVLLWWEYLKPIEEQSDRCIDFIYSLIQGK